jgi:hypothetical protein
MCSNGGYFSNGERLFLIEPGDFQEVCVRLMYQIRWSVMSVHEGFGVGTGILVFPQYACISLLSLGFTDGFFRLVVGVIDGV